MGAMTGRGAGFCAGAGVPGYATPVPGRGLGSGFGGGFGMGFGRGRGGRGRGFSFFAAPFGYAAPYQAPDPALEKQALRNQAEALRSELDFIKKRLDDIETGTTTP
jgi:hypothetical protein